MYLLVRCNAIFPILVSVPFLSVAIYIPVISTSIGHIVLTNSLFVDMIVPDMNQLKYCSLYLKATTNHFRFGVNSRRHGAIAALTIHTPSIYIYLKHYAIQNGILIYKIHIRCKSDMNHALIYSLVRGLKYYWKIVHKGTVIIDQVGKF